MSSEYFFWEKENDKYTFDNLLFREMTYSSQEGSPPHTHGQPHLIFFLQGTVYDVRKSQTFLRTPTTLILVPAEERHATHFCELVRTFEIVLPPLWTERVQRISSLMETPTEYQNGPPIDIAMRLYREFQDRNNLTPLMLEGLMLELLAQMARDTTPLREASCPRWLKRTQDYLHAHFTKRLLLETIADEIGVHPSHLVRSFRKHFHCTIGNYVRHLRIEEARQALAHSDTPLNEIALTVGYSDQSHFTTAFKRQTGLAPGEYRRICRQC